MAGYWGADPWARAELRWHDGAAWTEHIVRGGVQVVDLPPGAPATTPRPLPPAAQVQPTTAYRPFEGESSPSLWSRFRALPTWKQVLAWTALVGVFAAIGAANPKESEEKDSSKPLSVAATLTTDGPASSATSIASTQPEASTPVETATTMSAGIEPADTAEVGPPSDALALCSDGSYSGNTDFSATCSSHDGVDRWLAPYGECEDGTVIEIDDGASCDGHDGFKALLPPDFTTTTTQLLPTDADVAQCNDGTFSSNTDFSKTCSSHDGVDSWLAPYGTCGDGTVIVMDTDASCSGHDGFDALLPADYTPPTTLPPTTLPPPKAGDICNDLQARSGDVMCVFTGFGPVWIEAPFSEDGDQAAMLPEEPTVDYSLQVQSFGVLAEQLEVVTSYGSNYWCVLVGVKNFDDSEQSYSFFDFSLLTSTGSLQSATIPLVSDPETLLSSGRLAPGGSQVGVVCFDEPLIPTGRFALVFEPLSFFDDGRALFYFDR